MPTKISFVILCILLISGCATVQYTKPVTPIPGLPGIYHRIESGQTLWRISKIYSVDLDRLIEVNRISDVTKIEAGRLIFIPKSAKEDSLSISISDFSDDFIWPLKGEIITTFGQTYKNLINKGINIKPNRGLEVKAARSGKVVFYDDDFEKFGKTIIIDHQDGMMSVYSRNSKVYIKCGDYVKKGTLIARAGSTAYDKEVYLHFEIRKGHIPKNPIFYLP